MQLFLKRTLRKDCTTGVLTVGTQTFFTIEQPWDDNIAFRSCIPPGLYTGEPHNTAEHPNTYAWVNPDLNVFHELPPNPPAGARFACLIHPANWAFQLEGCMAPGNALIDSPRGLMVTNSHVSFDKIIGILGIGQTGHTLEITQ